MMQNLLVSSQRFSKSVFFFPNLTFFYRSEFCRVATVTRLIYDQNVCVKSTNFTKLTDEIMAY